MRDTTAKKFCRCIKAVRLSRKKAAEKVAIAICVHAVLRTKGKTLKRFKCRPKPSLQTQPLLFTGSAKA